MKKIFKLTLILIIFIIIVGCDAKNKNRILYSWHMQAIKDKNLIRIMKKLDLDILYQDFSSKYLEGNDNEFIKKMNENKIEVYHLAGDPSWGINNSTKAIEEIDKVINYNSKNKYKVKGIVFDIESYTLNNFNQKEYLKILKRTYKYAKDKDIYMVLCIPTWFSKYGENYLTNIITNTNDELSIMNYNTKKSISNIKQEMKIIKKYNKKVNTIYEISFKERDFLSNFSNIDNDYKKMLKHYKYPISLALHYYDKKQ